MKVSLDKAQNELTERKQQISALTDKLETIHETCTQLNAMRKRDAETIKKAHD